MRRSRKWPAPLSSKRHRRLRLSVRATTSLTLWREREAASGGEGHSVAFLVLERVTGEQSASQAEVGVVQVRVENVLVEPLRQGRGLGGDTGREPFVNLTT